MIMMHGRLQSYTKKGTGYGSCPSRGQISSLWSNVHVLSSHIAGQNASWVSGNIEAAQSPHAVALSVQSLKLLVTGCRSMRQRALRKSGGCPSTACCSSAWANPPSPCMTSSWHPVLRNQAAKLPQPPDPMRSPGQTRWQFSWHPAPSRQAGLFRTAPQGRTMWGLGRVGTHQPILPSSPAWFCSGKASRFWRPRRWATRAGTGATLPHSRASGCEQALEWVGILC